METLKIKKYTTNLENSGQYHDVVLLSEHKAVVDVLQAALSQSNVMLQNARDQRDKAFNDADKAETENASLKEQVKQLTKERDRQYEYNAGSIARQAELEAQVERLTLALKIASDERNLRQQKIYEITECESNPINYRTPEMYLDQARREIECKSRKEKANG